MISNPPHQNNTPLRTRLSLTDEFVIAAIHPQQQPPPSPLRTSLAVVFTYTAPQPEPLESLPTQDILTGFRRPIRTSEPWLSPQDIVEDEFADVKAKLPQGISAIPDDLFSSETEPGFPLIISGQQVSNEENELLDEEDVLEHTVELRMPIKREPSRDAFDSSGAEIEFVLKERDDQDSDMADF